MVEVFRTNVKHWDHAKILVNKIHKKFKDYKANFDLEDCDKILRVENKSGIIQSALLINLLIDYGFDAEILPDDPLDLNYQTEKLFFE